MRTQPCRCASPDHHGDDSETTEARVYYTSIIDDGRGRALLASGPYRLHRDAQAAVRLVRARAMAHDAKASWYRYGTSSGLASDPLRVMWPDMAPSA